MGTPCVALMILVIAHLEQGAAEGVAQEPLDVPIPNNCTKSDTEGVPEVVQLVYQKWYSRCSELVHP